MKPHLLFLSWRDIKHPKAGGAEVFTHEMLRRVSDDYEITHFLPHSKADTMSSTWTESLISGEVLHFPSFRSPFLIISRMLRRLI